MKIRIPRHTRPTHLFIDKKGHEYQGIFITDTDFAYLTSDNINWATETIKAVKQHASLLPSLPPCPELMGTTQQVEEGDKRLPTADDLAERIKHVRNAGVINVRTGEGMGKLERELDKIGFKHHDLDSLSIRQLHQENLFGLPDDL